MLKLVIVFRLELPYDALEPSILGADLLSQHINSVLQVAANIPHRLPLQVDRTSLVGSVPRPSPWRFALGQMLLQRARLSKAD
jgi:hypothetical protein